MKAVNDDDDVDVSQQQQRRCLHHVVAAQQNQTQQNVIIIPEHVEHQRRLIKRQSHSNSQLLESAERPEQRRPSSPPAAAAAVLSMFIVQVTAIASLGGILFGYDIGVIASALPQMQRTFHLNSQQSELIVSILYLGGGLGALLGGSLCDTFGRKKSIMYTDLTFGLGALILLIAPNITTVVIGRIVVGFAIAVSGIADVSYLHEIAPIQFRGSIVSVNEACISLGFLLAFGIGSLLAKTQNGWRMMFGISGVIAIIQYIGMWNMPESPVWLKEQGRHEEAALAMARIRQGQGNSSCTTTITAAAATTDDDHHVFGSGGDHGQQQNHRTQELQQRNSITSYDAVTAPSEHSTTSSSDSTWSGLSSPALIIRGLVGRCSFYCNQFMYLLRQLQVFVRETRLHYRRQGYVALFLAVTQQLCGQTNVLSYAPIIFANSSSGSGSSASSSSSSPDDYVRGWATLSIGIVKFIVTVVVIWKIESIGRRVLLLTGMAIIAIGLLLLAIAFSGAETTSADQETAYVDNAGTAVEDTGNGFYLAMPGVLLVVCGYSMSFGPLTWLLTSELFPTDIRGRALGFSTIITYLCAAFVTITFLSAQEWFSPTSVFFLYLLVTCLGFIFAYTAIPDTKEKTTEEIEDDFDQMLWWRGLQRTCGRCRRGRREDTSPLFGMVDENGGSKVHETELT